MTTNHTLPVIAILNSDDDVLTQLRQAFEAAAFSVVTEHVAEFGSEEDLIRFLDEHQAQVILYDIARPLATNVAAFQRLYAAAQARDYAFIVTTPRRVPVAGRVSQVAVAEAGTGVMNVDDAVRAARYALAAHIGDGVAR